VAAQRNDKPVGDLFIDIDRSDLNARLYRQIGFSLVSALVAVLIAGMLVQWMSRVLTEPLRRLSDIAEKVDSQDEYSLRAVLDSNRDEVGQLTLRFNIMLEHIEMQNSALLEQQKILLASEQRLLLANASAGLGVCDWNLREKILVWDDRMFELFGLARRIAQYP
jgi:nitrogen fixation/metabolism regulation signal transduction histidine kinase